MSNPTGQYTDVRVVAIQGHGGNISGATGTYSNIKVFSCGPFPPNDRPAIDGFYNITGKHNGQSYSFPGVKCTHSGGTSDFRDPST
ncbi:MULTISPECIES: hypothetical protein [Paracoccaceae]|jgi:hypothetical protein|uniref:hypothetical protein n=1 Tax=Rhodobacterales TaxID=204455 RepID=UPI001B1791E0|nr:hypothetical protein [Boseongicola sp. H5]MBO6604033.1 hypothetical protein [Roseicyclus sp.]MBO6626319.1 hypothetical protein [Roseicyclus sp.]MBO6924246.1 hypothetical protein [Roseicyclus sp.]